jgi:hypothetical protein
MILFLAPYPDALGLLWLAFMPRASHVNSLLLPKDINTSGDVIDIEVEEFKEVT